MDASWEDGERSTLLTNILELTKTSRRASVNFSTFSTKYLDWGKVTVPGRSIEECKVMLESLLSKVRRYRIMEEVVNDARLTLNDPTQFPDYPKKPMAAYMLFSSKRSKKLFKKGTAFKDVAKTVSDLWKNISEEDKEHYIVKAKNKMVQYRKDVEDFKLRHPGLILDKPVPPMPCNMFANSRVDKLIDKHPEMPYPIAFKKCCGKYANLSDEKKLKWIRRSLDAQEEYKTECAAFIASKPDAPFKPMTNLLSKAEQVLIDEADGKPGAAPPRLLIYYFISKHPGDLAGVERKDRIKVLRARYTALAKDELEVYRQEHDEVVSTYCERYTKYHESLSEEEQEKGKPLEEVLKPYKKPPVKPKAPKKTKPKDDSKLPVDVNRLLGQKDPKQMTLHDCNGLVTKLLSLDCKLASQESEDRLTDADAKSEAEDDAFQSGQASQNKKRKLPTSHGDSPKKVKSILDDIQEANPSAGDDDDDSAEKKKKKKKDKKRKQLELQTQFTCTNNGLDSHEEFVETDKKHKKKKKKKQKEDEEATSQAECDYKEESIAYPQSPPSTPKKKKPSGSASSPNSEPLINNSTPKRETKLSISTPKSAQRQLTLLDMKSMSTSKTSLTPDELLSL